MFKEFIMSKDKEKPKTSFPSSVPTGWATNQKFTNLRKLDNTNSTLTERLVALITAGGKSVKWLYDQLCDRGAYRSYETILVWVKGTSVPGIADAIHIANIYGVPSAWLLLGYRDIYTAFISEIAGVMVYMPLRDVLALVPDDTKVVLVNKSTDKQYNIFANSVADLLETFTNVTILSIKRKTEANGFVLVVEIETKTDSK
jgi:hypothetical protein